MNIETIKNRSKILSIIRDFFTEKNYLELETPTLSRTLIPESNIEVFKTDILNPYSTTEQSYLIPSPEVWLKQFLSENHCNIFEISRCFRNSEQSGKHHNPEFTMVEYYSMGFTHLDTLELTVELLNYINFKYPESKLSRESTILTMDQAFIKYAGFSLKDNYSINDLQKQAKKLNIYIEKSDDWETSFNRIFLDKVEPNIPRDKNVFLTDFPSNIKTLAKNIPGTPWAQRWELYINGIECGNCYTEENDPTLVSQYFTIENEAKKDALVKHNTDPNYYKIFNNFPNCSGGAIGVDRLVMAILGLNNIGDVILYPYKTDK